MGVARLLDRVADLTALADGKPVHVVVSRSQKGTFKRNEIEREIQRSIAAASVHFIPNDIHVETAAWDGTLVAAGEFTKAIVERPGTTHSRTGSCRPTRTLRKATL